MWPLGAPSSMVVGHNLPAGFGEDPGARACDEARAIFKGYPTSRLDGAPMREYACLHVSPVPAAAHRAVEHVAGADLRERTRAAVSHEDRRVAREAVNTTVLAAAVGVDR